MVASACLRAALLSPLVAAASANFAADKQSSTQPDVRMLKFPNEYAIGALLLFKPPGKSMGSYVYGTKQIAGAKGFVKVVIPPEHYLVLGTNGKVFKHP